MITGQHALRHGVVGNDILLRTDAPGIAKALTRKGYRTGYVGKWHLDGPDRTCFTPPGPRRHGFQFWAVSNCNHLYFEAYLYRDDPEPIWLDGYEPTAQTDIAIEFLREAARESEPFCLWLSWGPPHCPYDHVPARFRRLYDAETLSPRPNAVRPDRNILAGYYAHISALDWNFGRLMDALEETGRAGETLVLFTSDHGDMLFSHDRGWKSKPWAESLIVPLLARWPGVIPEGHVETAPFGLVDLTPTLCAVADAPADEAMEGRAWPDMLLGRPGPRPSSQLAYLMIPAVPQSFPDWRGVVTERHTYARFREDPWVLYDDAQDPYQMRNLAQSPQHADLRRRLEDLLAEHMEQIGDTFETPDQLARRYGVTMDERGFPLIIHQPRILEEQRRRAADRLRRMEEA